MNKEKNLWQEFLTRALRICTYEAKFIVYLMQTHMLHCLMYKILRVKDLVRVLQPCKNSATPGLGLQRLDCSCSRCSIGGAPRRPLDLAGRSVVITIADGAGMQRKMVEQLEERQDDHKRFQYFLQERNYTIS